MLSRRRVFVDRRRRTFASDGDFVAVLIDETNSPTDAIARSVFHVSLATWIETAPAIDDRFHPAATISLFSNVR
jgi:hypothetical protein